MKNFAVILLILVLTISSISQEPDSESSKNAPDKSVSKESVLDEKEEFENAIAQSSPAERITALQKFLEKYPESESKVRAIEIIASSRAEIADEKLRLNEADEGVRLFKLAVKEAPTPVSDKFFSRLLVKFPANLFFRGQRGAALDVARLIEQKIGDNPTQLLGLATFYLSVEQATEAKRLANRSIELRPELSSAYHTLGFAHRLDFDLEKASEAYSKALELDSGSLKTKNSLAEMKRALGKPDEAIVLYREILETEPSNTGALTGLNLSMFDAGNREEAERELAKNLETNPKNLSLLVGAAYWYAANDEGARAVEVAQKALAIEPRYTWGYIALARGLSAARDPMAAERTLLTAKQFGNFPTLSYELAAARFAAGFYMEAAEGLKENFTIQDGLIKTRLGGRVEKTAENFQELLSNERRASIFQFEAADRIEDSRKLKVLLEFAVRVESPDSQDSEIELAADEFISGDDGMKFHRQIFVANRLLNKKRALGKVLTITEEAVSGVDSALMVSTPSAAVLADELYASRKIALSRGEAIIVPNIPKQTLSKIVRGRIEEISGWTLFQQDKPDEAATRLRLAVSVLPADSAWSRSSYWKLGTVLESLGKRNEALDAYIRGYTVDEQNAAKKLVLENVYTKINGSMDGFEARLQNKTPENDAASMFTIKAANEEKKNVEPDSPKETPADDAVSQNTSKEVTEGDNVIAQVVPAKKPAATAIEEISLREPASGTKDGENTKSDAINKTPADQLSSNDKNPIGSNKVDQSTADTILDPRKNIGELTLVPEEKPAAPDANKPSSAALELPEPIFEPIIIRVPEIDGVKKEVGTGEGAVPKKGVAAKTGEATEAKIEEKDDGKVIKSPEAEKVGDNVPADNPNEKPAEADDAVKPEIATDTGAEEKDRQKTDEKPEADKKPDTDKTVDNPPANKPAGKPTENAPDTAPLERPRIVREDKPPDSSADKKEAEPRTCDILISQDSVSIINGGGSIGILIGLEEGKGDPKKIKATSSSPNDIEVILEPEIGSRSERAFFVVRSTSEKLGLYNVVFETPCGRQTVKVNVR